ncbi:MAG TPA: hypothetical protein VMF89_23500, partial [Polyangiales bacterium]|nr:hypothetical protein [Polyangiales bacterium]
KVVVTGSDEKGVIYGSTFDRAFSDALLRAIVRRRRLRSEIGGELVGSHTRAFRAAWTAAKSNLEPMPQQTDQCFTVINYGTDFVLKMYRKMEEGINPGREIPEFLCDHTGFRALPAALGSLDFRRYRDDSVQEYCVGTLSSAVPNSAAGWQYTVDQLGLFFEHTLAIPQDDARVRDLQPPNMWAPADPAPPIVGELLGNYLDTIRVLARRTSELHTALSSRSDIPDFTPEPFTTFYRQSVYHGMLGQLNRAFELLRSRARLLPPEAQQEVSDVLNRESDLRAQLLVLRDTRMSGTRIRNHGDYHLSNVLFSGSDWVITNFEGDPGRPLSERRIKRSALR